MQKIYDKDISKDCIVSKILNIQKKKIMQFRSLDASWAQRTKWLTQVLMISGTLNIGLLATFAYLAFKQKEEPLIELKPVGASPLERETNYTILSLYSLLPYQELIFHLGDCELVEDGLLKRDLSLACLVNFHHFSLNQALGGAPLQKRMISLPGGKEIPLFPGLDDDQFQAVIQYAKTEKWPLTTEGLFYELKRASFPEGSLLDAFSCSFEYLTVATLFSKTGLLASCQEIVALLCDGEWEMLSEFAQEQRASLNLTVDRRRLFLLNYLMCHSQRAAKMLLDFDFEFVSKRLNDSQVLHVLDLYPEKNNSLEALAKELVASPRTDAVWRRAAAVLYAFSGESLPEPYDHSLVVRRYFPQPQKELSFPFESVPHKAIVKTSRKMHTVEPGESLWKIARKYRVSVEELMQVNHLETERLRPGKQLEIPEK